MVPAIENPQKLDLSIAVEQVLKAMFAGYRRVIITKAFGYGLSGSHVLEVRPIKADGIPELPTVVKSATISLIQKEWQAYRQHIRRRLPYIAEIRSDPVLLPDIGWGGLRYRLMGGGTFEVVSLRDHFQRPELTIDEISLTLDRLFRIMHHIWGYNHLVAKFHLGAGYDHLLPVHLLIEHRLSPSALQHQPITPATIPTVSTKVGDPVHVSGFALSKVNPDTQTITLKQPQTAASKRAYFLRCKSSLVDTLAAQPVNHIIDPIEGTVSETQAGRLQNEVGHALGPDFDLTGPTVTLPSLELATLPNPLAAYTTLLQETRPVNVASIHGDFNLENILIEPETGTVSLIDFAEAREDHVLHDLLRLETEVMTKLVAKILYQHHLPPDLALAPFYWPLHWAAFEGDPSLPFLPHPDLEKPWTMLRTIRRTARQYFVEANDFSEYYRGLTLYLLGALKFKNLNNVPEQPLPKQVAFWGAAFVYQLLISPPHNPNAPPLPLAPTLGIRTQAATESKPAPLTQAEAQRRLAALPVDTIPTPMPFPPKSRMPLGRNPLFVGRKQDLKRLALALKGGETIAIGQVETAATTGLGGIGKTQLASEFVHRYGQYFAGGVFWLSFADPKAIPAEIAACGGIGALELRPNFGDLPLEDQIRLVQAAWQESVPRLLIFDNCEEPELLAQWRPASGGCRVLVTSRRADWEPALAVQSLPLDVLRREESIALLRQHQPDAGDATLDAIAAELGDLPLALHLAGSYMARYRRAITPAQYLEQLRDPNLLEHPSFKGSGISPTGHVQNVYRTIALSYDKLDPDDPVDN